MSQSVLMVCRTGNLAHKVRRELHIDAIGPLAMMAGGRWSRIYVNIGPDDFDSETEWRAVEKWLNEVLPLKLAAGGEILHMYRAPRT